jgi:hypothetical protein
MSTYDQLAKLDDVPKTQWVKNELRDVEHTPKSTQESTRSRHHPRSRPSDNPRKKPRVFPTRNEIQEFSFRMRDQLKVKVQAEVPHSWQKELEEIARKLNVRKLELYRFMIGEFLGKVKRKEK